MFCLLLASDLWWWIHHSKGFDIFSNPLMKIYVLVHMTFWVVCAGGVLEKKEGIVILA